MIRAFNCAAILVVLSIFWVPWAIAGDLSADYLYGRWVIDQQNCSSPDSEYIEFRKNGTFESSRTEANTTIFRSEWSSSIPTRIALRRLECLGMR